MAWLSVAGTFRILASLWSALRPAARPFLHLGDAMAERASSARKAATVAASARRETTVGKGTAAKPAATKQAGM